ncbi:MAG TPA: hypothetical protein VF678_01715 [bacterium]
MAAEIKSAFTTIYEDEKAGTVAFDAADGPASAIQSYLALVKQIREDYKDDAAISQGLKEVETKLNTLRFSKDPEDAIFKQIETLVQVPIGGEKVLRLDAFRRTAAKSQVANEAEYVDRVKRLVRNTMNNLTLLLITWPDDAILQRFLADLKSVDFAAKHDALREKMETVGKGPQLWHYNQKKKQFLADWLRPFQGELGTKIESMTEEEFTAALKKVEGLREKKLKDTAALVAEKEKGPYAAYNKNMHTVLNGKFKDFWGTQEVREEFIALINKLIARFSFNLQDRFLLFKTADGGFLYLVGFADEAFDNPVQLEGGKLGLFPHMKVFLKRGDDYQEIQPGNYTVNKQAYFRTLKTAVVPFFTSVAPMLEHTLSQDIKSAFDMWI